MLEYATFVPGGKSSRMRERHSEQVLRRQGRRVGSPANIRDIAFEEPVIGHVVKQSAPHPAEHVQGDLVTRGNTVDISGNRVVQPDAALVDQLQYGGAGKKLRHAADAGAVVGSTSVARSRYRLPPAHENSRQCPGSTARRLRRVGRWPRTPRLTAASSSEARSGRSANLQAEVTTGNSAISTTAEDAESSESSLLKTVADAGLDDSVPLCAATPGDLACAVVTARPGSDAI